MVSQCPLAQSLGTWPDCCWLQLLDRLRHCLLIGVTLYVVIVDVLEGRFTKDATGETKDCIESLTLWRLISMIGRILLDMIALGEPVIIRYRLIPVVLSSWSLLFSGTKFEYIVAAKPPYEWIPCLWYSS